MRIEVTDYTGQKRRIDTFSMHIAGDWLTEQARAAMSNNAMLGAWQLQVWPSTHEEADAIIGVEGYQSKLDETGLLRFADKLITASKLFAAHEENRRGNH